MKSPIAAVIMALMASQATASKHIPTCKADICSAIETYWGDSWPSETLKKIENAGQYKMIHSNGEVPDDLSVCDAQCVSVDCVSCDQKIIYTINEGCSNYTEAISVIEDDEGKMTTKCGCYKYYPILVSNGVWCDYICRVHEGYTGNDEVSISIDHDRFTDPCNQATVRLIRGVLNIIGLVTEYSWDSSCFPSTEEC